MDPEDINHSRIKIEDLVENREIYRNMCLEMMPDSARKLGLKGDESYYVCFEPSCENCGKSDYPKRTVQIIGGPGRPYFRYNGDMLKTFFEGTEITLIVGDDPEKDFTFVYPYNHPSIPNE